MIQQRNFAERCKYLKLERNFKKILLKTIKKFKDFLPDLAGLGTLLNTGFYTPNNARLYTIKY
jgi:hypothetical protein